ncbi:MAG: M1 family aminopeptidase, partial [Bacteroidia bacterium]|nr:M1 family aminopeptidase [Bacteroidia bacterium]MDW8417722.1 M1 family aminopeptidase [Bacteroidia bacterium]
FRVAPPDSTLEAQAEWHFKGAWGDTLVWDFGEGLSIERLEASFSIAQVWRDERLRKLYLRSTDPLNGHSEWVRVQYRGVPRSTGFGSYAVQRHATGWAVWTLSQPYGAPDWLFCKEGLEDKVDSLDIVVCTPDTIIGVANGKLIADSIDSQRWRWRHFKHRYPIATYLIAFAASNYVVQDYIIQSRYGSFPLRNYIFPQDTTAARQLSERFLPYFDWLEARLGGYPFAAEGYNQVQIGWRGGMEHQTITFFGSYSLELWAHELAHQWFGDWVTCGSWQDIWLNEAFGTYLGGTVYEALAPEWWHKWLKVTIKHAWRDTVRTIYVEDTSEVWRIFHYPTTYAKGALALHSLRDYVGDSLFWGGLRLYLRRHGGGFARTPDFEVVAREAWGDLAAQAFIRSWIHQAHYPRATVKWENTQTCIVDPVVPYPLHVPFWVTTISGERERVSIDFLVGRQRFTFSASVVQWEVDPDTLSPYWADRRGGVPGQDILLCPNPFSDFLYLNGAGLERVELWDTQGRLCYVIEAPYTQMPLRLDLSFLPSGCYLLHLEERGRRRTFRVVRTSP